MSGSSLGRPPKDKEKLKEKKRQDQDERDRIPVEGKFGQCKRRFGLGSIMGKLAVTSESMIAMTFFVVNLLKLLAEFLFVLFLRTAFDPNRVDHPKVSQRTRLSEYLLGSIRFYLTMRKDTVLV